jgi:hypothetical protein
MHTLIRGVKDRVLTATWLAALILSIPGCGGCERKEPCVDNSKPQLDECRVLADRLQSENNSLKRQLAQALANPETIKVDPSVLTIDGKPIRVEVKEGSLSEQQVIATMRQNKGVLQACYERAMKKNTALTHQKITLTVGFRVRPDGTLDNLNISPNYDSLMIDCMKKAVLRWRFPAFVGQPVGVESPLTLTPRK